MAQFSGFVCDICGIVIASEDRTRKTVKLDGPEVSGEYVQDLCREHAAESVPEDVDLRPLRRRRTSVSTDSAPAHDLTEADSTGTQSGDTVMQHSG